jgi:hypothetical protein
MSFPLVQPHLGMRSQLFGLFAEPTFYGSGTDLRHPTWPPSVPTFEPASNSASSFQAQRCSTATNTSQTQPMPLLQTWQRNAVGSSTTDPFIDATKRVGPTSFGVLKIRNVSPGCETMARALLCASRSSDAPAPRLLNPHLTPYLCLAHVFCRFRTMSPDQKLFSSLVKSPTLSRTTPWAVRYT